jgi:methylated-DNA-[protein]-cysteine S-methyltransferase
VRTTWTTVPSPLEPITLVAVDGVLTQLFFQDTRRGKHLSRDGGVVVDPQPPPADAVPDPSSFQAVGEQLAAYFRGELTAFDVPLGLAGTPFQQRVWAALREVPYGETVSYGELAQHIGQPTASRAVGLANGRNPIGVIVPCHRVIGSGGKLVGYGGGLHRKRHLLDLEQQTLFTQVDA